MLRLHCIQCGHVWKTRTDGKPLQCPKCKSLKWNDADNQMTRTELISEINAEYASVYSQYIQAVKKPTNGVDYQFGRMLTYRTELIRLEYRFKAVLDSDKMPAYLIGEILKEVCKG